MSNALAIAHVTQALAVLIENNLRPDIDIAVTVETRKPPADPPPDPTINVFLYQVTPNPNMRNTDLVTRASDGTLIKRAAAALDLHYVISAYGEENELVGQRLIGSVVRTLHEIPALPQDVIETAGERPYLHGSDLIGSPQRVRFTPQVMDVDETSKLWGMLYQTPYTLSVVYTATLVMIDGRELPVPGRPVERSSVRVLPFGAPGAPVPPRIGDGPPGTGPAGGSGANARSGPRGVAPGDAADGREQESGGAEGPATKAVAKRTAAKRTPASAGKAAKRTAERTGDTERTGAGAGSAERTSTDDGSAGRTAADAGSTERTATDAGSTERTPAKKAAAKKSAPARTRRTQGPKGPDGGKN